MINLRNTKLLTTEIILRCTPGIDSSTSVTIKKGADLEAQNTRPDLRPIVRQVVCACSHLF